MPSLGDAYGGTTAEWARRRLYLGAALLVVGAVVAAPGLVRVTADVLVALGTTPAVALALALALAGIAFPVIGAGLLWWIPSSQAIRAVAGGGVLVATVAVATFVAVVPPASLAGPADVPFGLLAVYGLGALAALLAPVVAAGLAGEGHPGRRGKSLSRTAFVRDRSSRPASRVPADGGDDSQELDFLLEDDDR